MEVINIILPVFAVIGLGYLLARYKIIRPTWTNALNKFVYYVSLPALIITSFETITWGADTLQFLLFHFVLIAASSVILLALLSGLRLNAKTKVTAIIAGLIGNTAYMGFPILNSTIPEANLAQAMAAATIQLISGIIVAILIIEYFILKSKRLSTYSTDIFKNPLMISVAAGVLLSALPHSILPNGAWEPIRMLGTTASPLALFTLGSFMFGKFHKLQLSGTTAVIVIKLILLPLVTWQLVNWLGFTGPEISASVIISAMPAAVTTFILAEKYQLNQELAANSILFGTLLSAITLPFLLHWLI